VKSTTSTEAERWCVWSPPPQGWEDYLWWHANDQATLKRINRLVDDALRDHVAGIGKPEPLRHVLAGCWSRRIDEEHRLVCLVDGEDLVVLQARYRYEA
jgi:toxin YoeB